MEYDLTLTIISCYMTSWFLIHNDLHVRPISFRNKSKNTVRTISTVDREMHPFIVLYSEACGVKIFISLSRSSFSFDFQGLDVNVKINECNKKESKGVFSVNGRNYIKCIVRFIWNYLTFLARFRDPKSCNCYLPV